MMLSFFFVLFGTFLVHSAQAQACNGNTYIYPDFNSGYDTRIQGVLASKACLVVYGGSGGTENTSTTFGLQLASTQSCPFCAEFSISAIYGPYSRGYDCESGTNFKVACNPYDEFVYYIQCTNTFSNCAYDFQFFQDNSASYLTCYSNGCSKKKLVVQEHVQRNQSCNGCYFQFNGISYSCGTSPAHTKILRNKCTRDGTPCEECTPSAKDKKVHWKKFLVRE
jgi:hypothetical protein